MHEYHQYTYYIMEITAQSPASRSSGVIILKWPYISYTLVLGFGTCIITESNEKSFPLLQVHEKFLHLTSHGFCTLPTTEVVPES